ncbi:hypothetical protein N7510_006958 [Penicillium lagena]|uniref:uncharacterized protein n=1 Tax=Penicillium lagena TaxID=94218 RepID=UPI0025403F06|nr:uncharacterized protein N7510_006958 [Penicillium lagena]KAJ5610239.1 hypothetical protein N7510_006958 [Penicillium lagena]
MARFNLSFFTAFLVLASFAIALPTKRDVDQKSSPIDAALGPLSPVTNGIMQDLGLDSQPTSSTHAPATSATGTPTATPSQRVASEPKPKQQEGKTTKPDVGEPTKTDKDQYTGNFVTPTAEQTSAQNTAKPNSGALGKVPIVGQLLNGGGLI